MDLPLFHSANSLFLLMPQLFLPNSRAHLALTSIRSISISHSVKFLFFLSFASRSDFYILPDNLFEWQADLCAYHIHRGLSINHSYVIEGVNRAGYCAHAYMSVCMYVQLVVIYKEKKCVPFRVFLINQDILIVCTFFLNEAPGQYV